MNLPRVQIDGVVTALRLQVTGPRQQRKPPLSVACRPSVCARVEPRFGPRPVVRSSRPTSRSSRSWNTSRRTPR